MAPWNMIKSVGEGANPNADILSDTSPRAIETVKSWTHVFNIIEHELINYPNDSCDEVTKIHETKVRDMAQSGKHKIDAGPRLMPYNDMIGWALENVDIQTKRIYNSQKVVVGSFQLEHIQVMYKLSPKFKYKYNATFIMEFEK
jgi:hypothetical protein